MVDRITWGGNGPLLDEFRRVGPDAWLARQLEGGSDEAMAPEARDRVAALQTPSVSMEGQVFRLEEQRRRAEALTDDAAKKAAQHDYQEALNGIGRDAIRRQFLRHLYSPWQLQERLTWFWTNHFSVHEYKHMIRAGLADYEDRLRAHSLGRFRDLLGVVVRHPVMLAYLDNAQNGAKHINENFARELLELHTLGVDGGYTQSDVQELARVLTGVGVNPRDPEIQPPPKVRPGLADGYVRQGLFEFNPNRHDYGDKQILGRRIRGRGLGELDEVLDLLAMHPATARHVCGRLARYFVEDEPSPELVARSADVYLESGGNIRAVMKFLVGAPRFSAVLGTRFKDPMQFVLSSLRLCYEDRVIPNVDPLIHWTNRLGESPYLRSTPDGYALAGSAWQGAGQMATRFEIARTIASNSAGLFRIGDDKSTDIPAFPQAARAYFYTVLQSRLSASTRSALQQATSAQEWNLLVLSSPEFMSC